MSSLEKGLCNVKCILFVLQDQRKRVILRCFSNLCFCNCNCFLHLVDICVYECDSTHMSRTYSKLVALEHVRYQIIPWTVRRRVRPQSCCYFGSFSSLMLLGTGTFHRMFRQRASLLFTDPWDLGVYHFMRTRPKIFSSAAVKATAHFVLGPSTVYLYQRPNWPRQCHPSVSGVAAWLHGIG